MPPEAARKPREGSERGEEHIVPGRAYGYENAKLSHSHAYLEKPLRRALGQRSWSQRPRALDYGCGSGAMTAWLAERGFSAVGVDISESGVEVARRAFPQLEFSVDVRAENLAALGPFELVTCVEVIAHCYYPEAELKKIFGVLQPGGVLVLSTPYHGYLKNLAMAASGRLQRHLDTLWQGAYVHFFTIGTITALLNAAGFVDISESRAGRIAPLAKSIVLTCRRPAN
jgi:2-polyprenyl-6-hydroxyphenyl methylase/3-demethylubiquinone-9 3-methyltransferase